MVNQDGVHRDATVAATGARLQFAPCSTSRPTRADRRHHFAAGSTIRMEITRPAFTSNENGHGP
jgi:hypothetical protein